MTQKESFPLCWPDGWPRTKPCYVQRSRFGDATLSDAVRFLEDELERLGASNVIISTNLKAKLGGGVYSNQPKPTDKGAAVYFDLKKSPRVLACDRWDRIEHNIWAIGKHVAALRGQDRWGVGSIEQAFAGYAALPETTNGKAWFDVLGVPAEASDAQIKDAWRNLSKIHHPDVSGGNSDRMAEINRAYHFAMKGNS